MRLISFVLLVACSADPADPADPAGSSDSSNHTTPIDTGTAAAGCAATPIEVWGETAPLVEGRESMAVVVYEDDIYSLGGWFEQTGPVSGAWRTTVNSDGETLADWDSIPDLPHAAQHHTATEHNGRVYLVGGDGNTTYDTVHVAAFDGNGSLGGWEELAPLPSPRTAHTAAVVAGRLYVIGGIDDFSSFSLTASVISASIESDGSLGAWEDEPSLPAPRAWHASAVVDGSLFVVGGLAGEGAAMKVSAEVLVGPLAWTVSAELPTARYRLGLLATDDALFAIGGASSTSEAKGTVYRGTLDESGGVGSWTPDERLPEPRFAHGLASRDGVAWVVGGFFTNTAGPTRDTVLHTRYCD